VGDSSLRRYPTSMPKRCVSYSKLRSNSEPLISRLLRRAKRQRKSSTSWLRLRRVCRLRDAPKCEKRCGCEWASPRKRRSRGQESQGRGQARAGQRIEAAGPEVSSTLKKKRKSPGCVPRLSLPLRVPPFSSREFHSQGKCLSVATQRRQNGAPFKTFGVAGGTQQV
jgi:hypothetical protein